MVLCDVGLEQELDRRAEGLGLRGKDVHVRLNCGLCVFEGFRYEMVAGAFM